MGLLPDANHVHLILTPQTADGLSRAVGEAHRRYPNFINARGRWTGHLFQSRFTSAGASGRRGRYPVIVRPVLEREPCLARLLADGDDEGFAALRRREGSGPPLGAPEFVTGLERLVGKPIARRAPARRPACVPVDQLDLL